MSEIYSNISCKFWYFMEKIFINRNLYIARDIDFMVTKLLLIVKRAWWSVFKSNIFQLFTAMRKTSPLLFWGWCAGLLLAGGFSSAMILVFGLVIANISSSEGISFALLILGVLFIFLNGTNSFVNTMSANIGAKTAEYLHEKLMHACMKPEGIAHLENSEIVSRLEAARDFDLGITGAPLVVAVPKVGARVSGIINGIFLSLILFQFQWWAPIVLSGAWLSTHFFLRNTSQINHSYSPGVVLEQRQVRYDYELMVNASAAKEVRIFGLSKWLYDSFLHRRLEVFNRAWKERDFNLGKVAFCTVIIIAANVLVFGSLASASITGELDYAWLVIFIQASVGVAQLSYEDDYFVRTAGKPIPLVLDILNKIEQLPDRVISGTQSAEGELHKGIRFENVSFNYPLSEKAVFKGLNLDIEPGTSLAVVGRNGAGKTTLIKLLGRLYNPTEGSIKVGAVNIAELDLNSWRKQLAFVFQDFIRYDWTLRDNVDPDSNVDDDFILSCLSSAGADNLTDLDSVMSRSYENGAELSGGQWQRIAIARAFAKIRKGAKLVILDEPTAKLDIKAEEQIFNQLLAETQGLTRIIISHRFSTVRKADKICVLDEGEIIETGTHDELMAYDSQYKKMFEIQSSRFKTEEEQGVA